MILSNANIFCSSEKFEISNLVIQDQKILKVCAESVQSSDETIIDCEGLYLVPGFIDIHFHGCNGHDFCEASNVALDCISSYELKHGITSICPATMTYPEHLLSNVMEVAANYNNPDGSKIVGINMEGPFISKDKIGAQNPKYVIKPDYEMLERLQKSANGLIKLIDIAPEVEGALDFITKASKNFVVSIAHTNCTYDKAMEAYKLGAKHLTHTFNAMPGIHHRNPGPIPAAAESLASAEIICDGQHIDYSVVKLAFKMFKKNICLISDSCEATGLDDREYTLGGQAIIKTGNKVVLKEDTNTIAASATNLYDCFCHAVKDANIKLEDAIKAVSINPAKVIGIDNLYGSIEPGKFANMLLVDNELNLKKVIYYGREIDIS